MRWSVADVKFSRRETSSASPRREPSLRVMRQSSFLARVVPMGSAIGLRCMMVRSVLDGFIWSDGLAKTAGASVSITVAISALWQTKSASSA
ncbi:unnamed protein product [Peronospora belbahrii]|uniref:Uncharacterized protein n=1 Tax=Peronospora belbahrii TaxID=622444 RepID=A0AAU9L8Y5_9STRA|nr:unnamed protein product [Peronospora belbahrii]